MKAQKAFDKRFKQKESGKHDYKPVKQVMFGKDVEKVFQKAAAAEYQEIFDFFADEHGLILTAGEMDDVVYAVQQWLKARQGDERKKWIPVSERLTEKDNV